jgi:hypothetical protein
MSELSELIDRQFYPVDYDHAMVLCDKLIEKLKEKIGSNEVYITRYGVGTIQDVIDTAYLSMKEGK